MHSNKPTEAATAARQELRAQMHRSKMFRKHMARHDPNAHVTRITNQLARGAEVRPNISQHHPDSGKRRTAHFNNRAERGLSNRGAY